MTTNFVEHFLDEAHGSAYPLIETKTYEMGKYLCVKTAQHPLHIYQIVSENEYVHPAVAQVNHNGQTYKLAWIEDEQW